MSEKRTQKDRDDVPESSASKKAKHEEEQEEIEGEDDSDAGGSEEEEETYSNDQPSSDEDDDDDISDGDEVDEEQSSDGGGAIIEGLEVELKKMDDGNFLLLQVGDAPRELKVVTPSSILTEISKYCEEKFSTGLIPVVDAKDIEVVTDIDEELVCHAEVLEPADPLTKSTKELEHALKEEWIVIRIEGHKENFGTLHFASCDEGEQ